MSATRLGSSVATRATLTGCPVGVSNDIDETGASDMTQVSLLPPPLCIETTGFSAELETRVSPPGIAMNPSAVAAT